MWQGRNCSSHSQRVNKEKEETVVPQNIFKDKFPMTITAKECLCHMDLQKIVKIPVRQDWEELEMRVVGTYRNTLG